MNCPYPTVPARVRGFTLLELTLVLLILALLATVSLSIVENDDSQIRYDRTVQTLDAAARGVLDFRIVGQSALLSGFVVDNGRLPPIPGTPGEELRPLVDFDDWQVDGSDSWSSIQTRVPWVWIDAPDPLETPIPERIPVAEDPATPEEFEAVARFSLTKGYRGNYIDRSFVDSAGTVRDGWGAPFLVTGTPDSDYGVATDPTASRPAGATPAIVLLDDWSVPLSALNIRIVNTSGTDISDPFLIALLVFRNDATADADVNDGQRWLTYRFLASPMTVGEELRTDQGVAWETNDTDEGFGCAPPGATYLVNASTCRIPSGRHLVVAVWQTGGCIGDTETECFWASTQFDVIPRALQPEVVLAISDPPPQ